MLCQDHQCGLRLHNVTEADAGIWRCEVMSSSSHPLDSVISLMRQMEEYRLGDWVAGARHEAQVELVIRNNEEEDPEEDLEIEYNDLEMKSTDTDPEIIFIDEEARGTTIETNKMENLGQLNPDNRIKESDMVDDVLLQMNPSINIFRNMRVTRVTDHTSSCQASSS